MDDPKTTLVRSWLAKARRDLESAQRLASEPAPYLDTAIYHCQQCAEKALKAFLIYHNVKFEKIHNLDVLLGYCSEVDSGFDILSDATSNLTPYATAFRYPDELFEPEPPKQQFDEAFHHAEQILNFVLRRLPESVKGT